MHAQSPRNNIATSKYEKQLQSLYKTQQSIDDSRRESVYNVKLASAYQDNSTSNNEMSNFSTKAFHDCSFAEESVEEKSPKPERFEENCQFAWEKQEQVKPSAQVAVATQSTQIMDQMCSAFQKNSVEAVQIVSDCIANRYQKQS